MKICFFGTPQFAGEILTHLIESDIEVLAVITKPDKPKGRSGKPVATPVKEVALKHHLPMYQPEKASDPAFYKVLKQYEADLFVVVAYGEILKEDLLKMPERDCINVHASLLPKYRGAAPIHWAIINGEKETGITIMKMVRKMDAGDILKQKAIPICEESTLKEIEKELREVGKELLLEVIQDYQKGAVEAIAQDESKVTYAPKIELEDCEIHWEKEARSLHNLIQGTNPFPGAWCWVEVNGTQKRLKVFRTEILPHLQANPGTWQQTPEGDWIVFCGKGALCITELQLEGKKPMSSEAFLRGISKDQLSFIKG